MRLLSLFSGIGGFDLAARWVWGDELEIVGHSEIDPYACAVYHKHFGGRCFGDIRTIGRGIGADLICGGFPCQPASHAGKRKGTSDSRWLWPEMLRVIREINPTWVVAENVRGLLSLEGGVVFEQVCVDLENLGYEVQPFVIPACAVNAPHRRDRVWIVAHAERTGAGCSRREIADEGRRTREDRGACIRPTDGKIGTGGTSPTNRHAPDTISHATGGAHGGEIGIGLGGWQDEDQRGRNEMGGDTTDNGRDASHAERSELEEREHARRTAGSQSELAGSGERVNSNTQVPRLQGSDTEGRGRAGGRSADFFGRELWDESWYEVALRTCVRPVDDGVPGGVVRPRGWRNAALKATGNAIVPQVAAQIFQAIKEIEEAKQ